MIELVARRRGHASTRCASGSRCTAPAGSATRTPCSSPPTATACCPPASTRPPTWPPTSASTGAGYRWRTRRWTAGSSSIRRRPAQVRTRADAPRPSPGDQVVVGHGGVRVHPPEHDRDTRAFEFMNSEVSSEKPKALLVRQVADRIRAAHDRGGRILAVCGPAVVHTGGGPAARRAGARRVDRRPVRRQRLRHPRHGVERARHVARRVGHLRPRHRGRALQPPPADQRGPPARLDRRRRRGGLRHRRRDVRVRAARRAVRARRLGPRRRAAARHDRRRGRRPPTPCASSSPA